MKEKKNTKKINIRRLIVLIVICIFVIIQLIVNRAEYLEIKEISEDYTSIFFKNFYMKNAVFGISFVVTYILFFINNKIIHKGMRKFFEKENKEMPKLPNKSISLIVALISGECSLVFLYEPFMTCINATSFGTCDPIFGYDIGFYTFILPFVKTLFIFLIVISLLMIIYTAMYYVISINFYFKSGIDMQDLSQNIFIKQIKFWAIIFGIFISGYILITAQDILTGNMLSINDSDGTELVGAGLTDTVVKLWGYRIFAVIVLVSIIVIVKNASMYNFKACVKAASIIPIYLVVLFGVLIYFQEIYVGSSELDKEETYISYNIEATKEAFGIDIEQTVIEDYETLTSETASKNEEVLDNVPLVNEEIITQTIEDTQDNGTYYNYSNSNLGLYTVNGVRTLLSITAREILTDSNRSYNNKTFEYTHGYSVVVVDPSEIDMNR